MYVLYLNGDVYGRGGMHYMHELITDYLVRFGVSGNSNVNFSIQKKEV